VRRIEGNIMAMKTDLQRALGLEDKEIVINQLTRHIIIKVGTRSCRVYVSQLTFEQGHKKPEVLKFLEENELADS
jgi:large subunit ribosomal protein L49